MFFNSARLNEIRSQRHLDSRFTKAVQNLNKEIRPNRNSRVIGSVVTRAGSVNPVGIHVGATLKRDETEGSGCKPMRRDNRNYVTVAKTIYHSTIYTSLPIGIAPIKILTLPLECGHPVAELHSEIKAGKDRHHGMI